ncbi:MAG TPA: hypothetical protein H9964_03860 [Candidatus Gallimonas intestinavium]|uniref:Uncharacterized protein n=1 Tax=Candidatus Gallimonas intestinavium TaxID=2838603 RepID=A0A9D2JZ70_9FIRM|nr:hypothetical protein [Candidatus Gallimonas intestinavium]
MNFMRKERKMLFVMFAVLCVLALSLGMALVCAPARALAAEGDVIEVQFNGETTAYTTVKDALAYIEEQETSEENRALIKLLDNYTLGANGDNSRFEIDIPTFAALDLNGYILRGSGSASVIGIYGDMILEDSQSESTAEEHQHDYYVDESGLWVVDDESVEWQKAYDAAENKGTITGGVITGGNSENYGGGIYLNLYGASGGGILTMNGGTIAGNQAVWGAGGVFVNRNTGFEMNGGIIAGNITPGSPTFGYGYGGGIMINDPLIKYCVINGGVIKENVANIGGGIVSSYEGVLIKITGGEIVNNYAPQAGGLYLSGSLELSGGEIYGNEAEIYGGMFVNDTLNMSGGKIYGNKAETEAGIYAATVNMSGGEVYDNEAESDDNAISAILVTVSGGKISGDISFIEHEANNVSITSGYFAEGVEYGVEDGNTVSGFSVAEGYAVVLLDENSGDENYSAEFPYAVYRIGSGGDVEFVVNGASAIFDGGQITAGGDFVLTATSGGTPIAVDEIAYSYSTDGTSFTEGLPSDAGTYTVKASVSGIIDAQNKVYYEGAEYTFAYEITPVQLTVAGVTVSVDGNDTVSVDSFSVVGIKEGTDVSVIVKSCTLLDDGRVHIVYDLSGSDAANYIVPADTYTTVQQSGLEEVNAAIASLNAAIEALKSSVASSDAALQSSISSLRSRLDQAVSQLEKSIADGDKANADALLAAKDELQKAFEAADAVLEGKIGELGEADKTLQAAIDAIDAAYKAADEALAGAIEELRAENAAQNDTIARQEEQLNSLSVVLWVTLAVAVVAFGVGAAGLVFGLKAKKKD